ncbi:MAG: peptidoglycan-binding protein [Bryobacteraceae bacterium]
MAFGDKKLEGGHAASHAAAELLPILAAPGSGKEKNTIRMELVAVACWRLDDVRFDFDSSFVVPQAKAEFVELAELNVSHAGSPYSIFGHADPVGNDNYNKTLSGRRARAIYGVLIRDTGIWEKLHTDSNGTGDDWNLRHTQIMLTSVGFPTGTESGSKTAQSTQAIKDFQTANGLTADGDAGAKTREKLFAAYFEFLSGPTLTPADFLAKGADPNGKGDYQGCSEFNPIMMFSAAENTALQSNVTERNKQNSVNRRILVLLFRPGTVVPAAKWPCPTWIEGPAGCTKRFFANAATRRQFQAKRRTVEVDKDTFACRFYERLLNQSPCEGPNPTPIILEEVNPLILMIPVAAAPAPATQGADAKAAGEPAGEPAAAAAPAINVDHSSVVVKRPYTNPDPSKLTLKTDADFDGTGTFTVNNKLPIQFTVKGVVLKFDGTDNVFDGPTLSLGVEVLAVGLTASQKKDDVVVTLALAGGTKKNGPPAKGKLTSVEITLDICDPRTDPAADPPILPTAKAAPAAGAAATDKFFRGRPIPVQSDPKIDERAILIVQKVKPADFAGGITLRTSDDRILLFNAETPAAGEVAVAMPHSFAVSTMGNAGLRFFVEGAKASAAARDTGITAEITGLIGTADNVRVTVCHTEIVSNRKPADLKIAAQVPEKPERKTKSTFFPAPIIVGNKYKVEMRPFIELAVPSAFDWKTPSDKITVTDNAKEVVKVEGAKVSAALNDVDLSVLLTTNIGKLLKKHKLTMVEVEIDPITSGDRVKPADDINLIKNPAGCLILAGGDAADAKKVPKYEITKITPNLAWTDDDDRIAWWILGGDAKADNKYDGKADFLNTEAGKRGLKIQVFGVTNGDVLIQPYSGGFGYGMIRVHVVPIRKIKYRVSRIFTKAQAAVPGSPALPGFPAQAGQPAFPGNGATAPQPEVPDLPAVPARPIIPAIPPLTAQAPTQSHAEAKMHMAISNIFLRQLGVEMVPDDSAEVATPVRAARPAFALVAAQPGVAAQPPAPGQPAVPLRPPIPGRPAVDEVKASGFNPKVGPPDGSLDKKVVQVTLVEPGHFDVEVNDIALTFNSAANQKPAIQINARNEVVSVAYIEQDPTFGTGTKTLSTALLCPANHAPLTRARQPEGAPNQAGTAKAYQAANFTLPDLGTPSTSLIPKTGIPPDEPADKVNMVVLFPDVNWQPASPGTRDVNLLWGIVVPTRNMDTGSFSANIDETRHKYGFVFAHEMGHMMGLGHRGVTTSVPDGLTIPPDKNVMRATVNAPVTENFDIIQVKACRFSEVMARNP